MIAKWGRIRSLYWDESNMKWKMIPGSEMGQRVVIDQSIKKGRRRNRRSTKEMQRIRRSLFKRDGEKCVHCSTASNLTVDHILPKSKGGTWKLHNLQMLCRPCHDLKDNEKGRSRRHILKRILSVIEKWK